MFPESRPFDAAIHLIVAGFCLVNVEIGPVSLSLCGLANVICAFVYLFGRRRIAAWWKRNIVGEGIDDF